MMQDTTGWIDRARCPCSSCTGDAASAEDFYERLRRDVVGQLAGPPARIHAVKPRPDFQIKDAEGLPDSRAVWTNALLNALADIGRGKGRDVVPKQLYYFRENGGKDYNSKFGGLGRIDDSGEFMVDMAWWPPGTLDPWWDQPSSIDLSCELAIESEWGAKEGAHFAAHAEAVANDYLKILSMRAQHRLLLTQCRDADRPRFIQILKKLRERAGLPAGSVCVWLWRDSDRWAQVYSPVAMTP